jgi:hypothetical protein
MFLCVLKNIFKTMRMGELALNISSPHTYGCIHSKRSQWALGASPF